ncbi:hypothetical protein LXL04_020529 [Taraxacum kok-saghyz]
MYLTLNVDCYNLLDIYKRKFDGCHTYSEDFVHEKFYTTDKKIKSLFNFIEGVDPKLIYQAFQAGLIDNIYPSCNLQEIRHFPNSMIEAIKNFRKKFLKAKDDPIYIKIISSIPDWHHDIRFSPYYFIENWSSKGQKRSPDFSKFLKESKKRVNYTSSNCRITSWSFSNPNEEDARTVSTFGEISCTRPWTPASLLDKTFADMPKQLFEDHNCHHCNDNNSMEGPFTEEDKSSTSQ